jgi:hypothetical protein
MTPVGLRGVLPRHKPWTDSEKTSQELVMCAPTLPTGRVRRATATDRYFSVAGLDSPV